MLLRFERGTISNNASITGINQDYFGATGLVLTIVLDNAHKMHYM